MAVHQREELVVRASFADSLAYAADTVHDAMDYVAYQKKGQEK